MTTFESPQSGIDPPPGDHTHDARAFRRRRWDRVKSLTPIDKQGTPDLETQNAMHAACLSSGVRVMPYPFDSAIGLASDIDFTDRDSFLLYTKQLVARHGLDFGDSIWLHRSVEITGQGFFDPWFRMIPFEQRVAPPGVSGQSDDRPADMRPALDLHEIAAEHHLGTIDHWHSFLTRGPRAILMSDLRGPVGGVVEARRRDDTCRGAGRGMGSWVLPIWENQDTLFATFADEMAISSVTVITDATGPAAGSAWMVNPEGRTLTVLSEATSQPESPDERRRVQVFEVPPGEIGSHEPIVLTSIESVRVEAGDGRVIAVMLHNAHTDFLLRRLSWLGDELDVSFNLSTCHAGFHFYAGHRVEPDSEKVLERLRERPGVDEALFGAIDTGTAAFSTVADDPRGFARVYPELASTHGVRFLNPHGAELDRVAMFSPFTMTYPCRTRAGGGLHLVRRVMPPLPEDHGIEREEVSRRTSAATFNMRLGSLIARTVERGPNQCNLFYTHLGNRIGWSNEPTEPYFVEDDAIIDVKNRHYGINEPGERIWFARASTLCDYSLMVQTLPGAVKRSSPATIEIASWDDPVFAERLPAWSGQMFGVTFYTDKPGETRVRLDGEPIEDLVLNPPDTQIGRPSVTVTTCGIRHPLVWWNEPTVIGETRNGEWSWESGKDGEPGVGRLDGRGAACVCMAVSPGRVDGSQVFSWWQRASDGAGVALVLVTESGGRFGFGDGEALDEAGELTARAEMIRPRVSDSRGEGWTRMSCPFWSMRWPAGTDPATTPLPSHGPVAVELWVLGEDAWAEAGRIELGRPRTMRSRRDDGSIALGGRVASGRRGVSVELTCETTGAIEIARSDAGGRFRFPRIEPGTYRIGRRAAWPARLLRRENPGRGAPVEVLTSRFDLVV